MRKRKYVKPRLLAHGTVQRLTLGMNGSSLDGGGTLTQLGSGNDPMGGPMSGN